MAVILVIDDHPTNRDFLVMLLGYRGHRLLQAADGAEALAVARAERPDLIISDILMPTMDGYEFVRQLRVDPALGHIPLIFSTAHYLDQEGSALAQQCGVPFILPKLSDPEAVLCTVDAALGLTPSPASPPPEDVFDRQHLRLMTNQLDREAAALQGLNNKLTALLDLSQHLVSEHRPQQLLEAYCRGAREIIGAKWAAVGILSDDQASVEQHFVSGMDDGMIASVGAMKADQGVLGTVVGERRPCRFRSVSGEPHLMGLPPQLPPIYSFLSVPIVYQTQVYGWLSLANKLGSAAFSDVDERVAVMLAAQMAVSHANAQLFRNVQRQTAELAQEVAERKRAEAVLRRSEQRYRDLIEGSIQGIAIYRNFTPLFVNQAFANIFGYTPEEILAQRSVITLFAPHEQTRLRQYHEARLRGEQAPHQYELQGVRKDGSVIWVETLTRPVHWEGELVTQATIVDISARKRAEAQREQLQAQLFGAQKMEAIGTLAGGIAHDFNNILGIMLGYTELTFMDVPHGSAAHVRLQKVINAGRRARDLVHQILTFSRKTEQQRQPIQLHVVVQEALKLLRASLPATIDIRPHLETTACIVLADPTQMLQVLMNLCANAEHAMRERGGVLEICLKAIEVTAAHTTAHLSLAPGPYVQLTVRDTGHGMESEILERIFEPFFTTKPVGEGTGLGLPVVHGIVANHGGAITVSSVLGQGTTFDIYLPHVDNALPESLPEIALVRGGERILFVDDESALADWGKQALESLGYDVVACTSGIEALNVFRAAPQAFHLLITDQTMPGMTGEVLTKEVRRIRPDLPIILCTGFSTRMTRERAEAMGIRTYLMKPIMQQDLGLAVRQVFDQRTP